MSRDRSNLPWFFRNSRWEWRLIRWLIKNGPGCPLAHKYHNDRKLISHTHACAIGKEARLNYEGQAWKGLIGGDRMMNMSRSSPPANCLPPIESSSLFRCNSTESFLNIVKDRYLATNLEKKSILLKVFVDWRGAIVNYIFDRAKKH